MPALHGSDDDFLFEVQCPKSWLAEQSAQPKTKTRADGLLARFLRLGSVPGLPRPRPLQSQIQPAGIGNILPPRNWPHVSTGSERASGEASATA